MVLWPKKLVTIVTEGVLEDKLTESLTQWGIKGYTITDARGKGHRGVRSADWDQVSNIRVEVVCDEAVAESLCGQLKEKYYANYAMILFVTDVMTLRDDKF